MLIAANQANVQDTIDLSPYRSFKEMKQGLNEQLALLRYPQGTQICLGIGQRRLTNRELKELELVLLSHGVYLLDIVDVEEDPSKDKPHDNMPHYRETMLLCRNIRSGKTGPPQHSDFVMLIRCGGCSWRQHYSDGCLRGMAHAGALGDQNAVISAYRLRPTQLRIADHITRPPIMRPTARNPELARIRMTGCHRKAKNMIGGFR